MVRPQRFLPNPETAADNVFQALPEVARDEVARLAHDEVTRAAQTLTEAGVRVHLFDDTDPQRPDSVFPNNWFSTHPGGHVALFPMYAPNRRTERRADIVEMLKRQYRVQQVIDYSGMEPDGLFLEGTGAMVIDHELRIVYVARSRRADPVLLERFCSMFGYEPMVMDAVDQTGAPIYHTNVMMTIATDFVMVGLGLIADHARREEVVMRLGARGRREIIDLTASQIASFAGNAIELQADGRRILALSTRALAALRDDQRAVIERSCEIIALPVPTIELAGGSVRCMIAGLHLDARELVRWP
ncbi:citrulline utilization hydrolase CtlX [Microbacterium sp. A588]